MAVKKDEAISEVLRMIAPGTPIRNGLENILKAKTGALIAIGGDNKEVMDLVDGGFRLDVEYTSSRLYELAKMDGAIILSSDFKKILYANAQLIPSSDIPTSETGTRHRTAERTAKQTGALVISISQRRGIITIFKGNSRYVLKDLEAVISKANQALQTVEKYKKQVYDKLSYLSYAPILFISAKTGQRVNKLFELINSVASQNAMRVSTSVLNQVLNEAIAIVQPPTDKGRRLRLFYMTQASTKPPTFVVFVNDKDLFHFSYERYLVNQIRKEFDLTGTPVRMIVREKSEKEGE